MKLSTGISQKISTSFIKFNWIVVLATMLFVCCTCVHSKPTDTEQLNDNQIMDSVYPAFLYSDDLVERAAPRLGRASPRLGRASPRLGRRAPTYLISRINHAGRYYFGDDEAMNDYPMEFDSSNTDKRAAPRLGRSV